MSESTPARREYDTPGIEDGQLDVDPLVQFEMWLDEAIVANVSEPNAMNLATADGSKPSVRTVLLRGIDHGIVFYTNYASRKGVEIAANAHAAANIVWLDLHRQVRFEGKVEKIDAARSDEYFASRPRGAQVAARASRQSDVIESRAVLEQRFAAEEAKFPDVVPRPDHWGGYRLVPNMIEFWQGRRNRLHDRIRYRREAELWRVDRLSP